MLRPLPLASNVSAHPQFDSPADVIRWVHGLTWLVAGERAALLHLDPDRRLTCLATAWGRLTAVGPLARDQLACQTLECGAASAVAVDVRRRVPSGGPSAADTRRHAVLRAHLAAYAVALLDTVIVAPGAGLSVTGELAVPDHDPGLPIHLPTRPRLPPVLDWTHDAAIVPFRPILRPRDAEPP